LFILATIPDHAILNLRRPRARDGPEKNFCQNSLSTGISVVIFEEGEKPAVHLWEDEKPISARKTPATEEGAWIFRGVGGAMAGL